MGQIYPDSRNIHSSQKHMSDYTVSLFCYNIKSPEILHAGPW